MLFATVLYLNNEIVSNDYFYTLPKFYKKTFLFHTNIVLMRSFVSLVILVVPVLIFIPNQGLNLFVLINLISLLFVLSVSYARPKIKLSESASTAIILNGIWYFTEITYLVAVEYFIKAQTLNQIALNTLLNLVIAVPLMILVIIFLRKRELKYKKENNKINMKRGSYVNG